MIINDINYLETTNEEVVGGYHFGKNINLNTSVSFTSNTDIDVDIFKTVDILAVSTVDVEGNFGSIEFDVTADGNNGFAESANSLLVTEDFVEAAGSYVAGVD